MSNFLIFFASGIADYLLFVSITAVVLVTTAWIITKLGKIRAPVYRHMIWLFTLFAVILLPVIWLYAPKLSLPVLSAQTQNEILLTQQINLKLPDATLGSELLKIQSAPKASPASVEIPQNQRPSIPVKNVLVCLWSIGFLFMLTRLFIGWYRIKRMVRSAEIVSDNIQLGDISSSSPKLLLGPDADSPLCFGILRPVILLPKRIYTNSASKDLHMILHHELAHIERRDCCINIFQRLIEAVLFFHPFIWYASFQLTQNREILCDQHVIEKGGPPADYVQLLTRIIEQGLEKNSLYAVALFEGRLLTRVRSLLDLGNKIQIKTPRWTVIAGAMVILMCMAPGVIRLEAKSSVSDKPELNKTENQTGSVRSKNNNQETESFRPQNETLGPNGRRPKGSCSISGKVVSAETGEPVGHATVYLFYTETFDSIFIKVASDGSFEFTDIPKGPFSLQAINTEGFQNAKYYPENSIEQIFFFSLKEGEKRSGIIFQLKPAHSISGKVLGEDGQPLRYSQLSVRAWVELEEPGGNLNRYVIASTSGIYSDGSYLLKGLDNRPVYVMVFDNKAQEEDQPWPPCYYPGTVARDKAEKVYFDNDRFVKNINIQLTKKGEFILEGVVSDENTGNPVSKTLVTIHHRDMLFDHFTTYTDEQGYYRIDSLGAGEFLLHVDAEPWGYVRTHKPVTIGTEQVTSLDFKLTQAAVISGHFINENGEPFEIVNRAYGLAFKYGYPNPERMEWTGTMNKYSEKGQRDFRSYNTFNGNEGEYEEEYMVFPTSNTFLIEGMLPGKTILRFHPKEEGTIVKQILYNGQDITDTGIETSPGEKIEGVSIVIETENNLLPRLKKDKVVSVPQLKKDKVAKGYMGVSIQAISLDLKDLFGLKDTRSANSLHCLCNIRRQICQG